MHFEIHLKIKKYNAEYIHVPSRFFKFAENCPPPHLLLVAALPECEISLKTSLVIAPGSFPLTEKFFFNSVRNFPVTIRGMDGEGYELIKCV